MSGNHLPEGARRAAGRGETIEAPSRRHSQESREPADEILTTREACALLKIGRTKLWELTRNNSIPAYRLGTGKRASLRYRRSDLLAFLDQNRI